MTARRERAHFSERRRRVKTEDYLQMNNEDTTNASAPAPAPLALLGCLLNQTASFEAIARGTV